MLDGITIIIMLIIFFTVAPGLNDLLINLTGLNPDSFTTWLLRGMIYIILLGVIRYTLKITSGNFLDAGGMEE